MKLPQTVNINGKNFALVKERRGSPMAVYKYGQRYMRAGDREALQEELEVRDKLKSFGFPVPDRFKESKTDSGLYYYIEKSIGKQHFGEVFKKEFKEYGRISDKSFKQFLWITKKFAVAQLKTTTKKKDFKSFGAAIGIRDLYKEFKSYKPKLERVYKEARERLSVFPFALSHGDFNPYNLYRKGVIDFEGAFYAPAGYDLVSNICTVDYVPGKGADFEFTDPVKFTEEQKAEYLEYFDKLYLDNGIPRFSDFYKYFEFCRGAWLTIGRFENPEIRKYRRKLFKERFIEA